MRAMLVVPVNERKKLATACFSFLRQQNPSRALVLQTSDQTLDHGDAPVLADSTVSRRLDALAFDPTPKRGAVEGAVSITDDVLGWRVGTTDRPSQKTHTARQSGRLAKTPTLIIRREKWSMTTATHQQKGQLCGKANGSHEVQSPDPVGTVVRSTCHTWFGSFAVTTRPVETDGSCGVG